MSTSLPEPPDLDQLRRQAKELRDAARSGESAAVERFARHHPSTGAGGVSLAAAQLVIARELGFSSWPALKAAVDAATVVADDRTLAFLAASIESRPREAARLLQADPILAGRDWRAAAVLGDTDAVRARLAADPDAALAVDHERGWPPLLYACYSRWHQIEPERAAGLAELVGLLLNAGASPNTNNGARPHRGYRSALHGSVTTNNPTITQLLLERGADPNDSESLYHAAGHRDHACLELLLSHGATVAGTWALEVAVHAGDAEAVSLLLRAVERESESVRRSATGLLADAAATASGDVVDALLRAGADPTSSDDADVSAVRLAVRAGRTESAELLVSAGASDDSTDVDRFIGACMRADRSTAERLLTEQPDLRDRLSDGDHAAVVDAAGSDTANAVAMMLGLGFTPHSRTGLGEQPLHAASYAGNAEAVRLLLAAGADVDARDDNFHATPLAYATVGSGERAGKPGDWIATVRLLIEADASRDGVWVSGKPPSEEVSELLRHYGIAPDEASEEPPSDTDEMPSSTGTGAMAEVARHLEAAYRDEDLDLLGSLLHPEVTWTGLCRSSSEVLNWYRGLQAEGTCATVESVAVDGDAVILELRVSRTAEGARPAPPQEVWQVFTVADAHIVDIRVYPDRSSALGRS